MKITEFCDKKRKILLINSTWNIKSMIMKKYQREGIVEKVTQRPAF
jgi:hypothetical protein